MNSRSLPPFFVFSFFPSKCHRQIQEHIPFSLMPTVRNEHARAATVAGVIVTLPRHALAVWTHWCVWGWGWNNHGSYCPTPPFLTWRNVKMTESGEGSHPLKIFFA